MRRSSGSRAPRFLRFRYLLSFVLAILVCVLWVRSYTTWDRIYAENSTIFVSISNLRGSVILYCDKLAPGALGDRPWCGIWTEPAHESMATKVRYVADVFDWFGIILGQNKRDFGIYVGVPHWLVLMLVALLAFAVRPRPSGMGSHSAAFPVESACVKLRG